MAKVKGRIKIAVNSKGIPNIIQTKSKTIKTKNKEAIAEPVIELVPLTIISPIISVVFIKNISLAPI